MLVTPQNFLLFILAVALVFGVVYWLPVDGRTKNFLYAISFICFLVIIIFFLI